MNHSPRGLKLVVLLLCGEGLFACAHTQQTNTSATHAVSDPGLCAFQVENSSVLARDVDDGEALDFTTQSEHVAEVRRKVRSIAAVYNHHASGEPAEGNPAVQTPTAHVDVDPELALPAANASVEEIKDGARLVLRPQDPADLTALRERARRRTGKIENGQCEPAQSTGT